MRILHVYKDYFPVVGGMENHIRLLAEAQAAAGHDVTVLVTAPGVRGNDADVNGVRVRRAGRLATAASAPLSPALALALRREEPDITHLHSPYPVGEAAWLAFGSRPMVVTYQSDIVRQRVLGRLWAPWLRRTLARADRILASSPAYVESSPFLRRFREKVTVVPLGIDPARFAAADRSAARRRFAPDSAPRVAFVGRFRYYKGLHVLVDAMRLLPEARLMMIGGGPEGPALRRQAESAGVAERVDWLGEVPDEDLPAALAAADVFVLPSTARSEAFGIVMLEAMAAGLPLVSTELGTGTSWINQHGHTGLVVEPGNHEALAAAINGILADDDLRQRLGRSALERVRAEFDADQMVERVMAVYEEVML
ncbi:MAG: glycosyltransferase [Anaerolineae bacterium]|jgi:rhamnosyl/mannosyltransferase